MTITVRYPDTIAADDNYSSGPATGTATKVDPGVVLTAQGVVPGRYGAQHLNHWFYNISVATRLFLANFLSFRSARHTDAPPTTVGNMAALFIATFDNVIVSGGGTNGTVRVNGDGHCTTLDDLPNDPMALAWDGTSLVAVIDGTGFAYRSTDLGVTWTIATTKPAAAANDLCVGSQSDEFLAVTQAGALQTSPTGDVWTARSASAITPQSVAFSVDPSGSTERFFACDATDNIEVSSDTGVTWAAAPGSIPDSCTKGWIAQLFITSSDQVPYYVGYIGSGTFRLYRGNYSGSTWTQVGEFSIPGLITTPTVNEVRLHIDSFTGAMYVHMRGSTLDLVWCSLDQGETWPSYVKIAAGSAFCAAGGYAFTAASGMTQYAMSGQRVTALT